MTNPGGGLLPPPILYSLWVGLSAYAMFGGPRFQDATSDIYTFGAQIFDFSSFAIIYNVLDHFSDLGAALGE